MPEHKLKKAVNGGAVLTYDLLTSRLKHSATGLEEEAIGRAELLRVLNGWGIGTDVSLSFISEILQAQGALVVQ